MNNKARILVEDLIKTATNLRLLIDEEHGKDEEISSDDAFISPDDITKEVLLLAERHTEKTQKYLSEIIDSYNRDMRVLYQSSKGKTKKKLIEVLIRKETEFRGESGAQARVGRILNLTSGRICQLLRTADPSTPFIKEKSREP